MIAHRVEVKPCLLITIIDTVLDLAYSNGPGGATALPPETFEVPNTSYHALHFGTHVDLSVTDRASVGFGGKYFHVLESGDLSSVEWYGPGSTSGISVDGNFVIPVLKNIYVRGEVSYSRFKTSFDGVGVITEDEGVYEAVDSNVGLNLRVGVEF